MTRTIHGCRQGDVMVKTAWLAKMSISIEIEINVSPNPDPSPLTRGGQTHV